MSCFEHAATQPMWQPEHGGPDMGPTVRWDFSTNANPLPSPARLLRAVADADRTRYPEPTYQRLLAHLAEQGMGEVRRLHPTAGSAEGIRRLTLALSLHGVRTAWVPQPGYGDYAAAARALGLVVQPYRGVDELAKALSQPEVQHASHTGQAAHVVWVCDPCNPTGQVLTAAERAAVQRLAEQGVHVAVDLAYAPLQWAPSTSADMSLAAASNWAAFAWQLWSPNKALGMTGVRAGVLVAPEAGAEAVAQRVCQLAPSWVLSAEGVALLQAWWHPHVQTWLHDARDTLRGWQHAQAEALRQRGWQVQASHTPFNLVQPNWAMLEADAIGGQRHEQHWLHHLQRHWRREGVKVRDAASLGAPGCLRMSVQPPAALLALLRALDTFAPNSFFEEHACQHER